MLWDLTLMVFQSFEHLTIACLEGDIYPMIPDVVKQSLLIDALRHVFEHLSHQSMILPTEVIDVS